MNNNVYIYKRNGNEYVLISDKCRFKNTDGQWIDAILYQPRYENTYEFFMKSIPEFNDEFSLAYWNNSIHKWVATNTD